MTDVDANLSGPVLKVIADAVDATFMQRGFNATRHAGAVIKALNSAGYIVAPASMVNTSPAPSPHIGGRATVEQIVGVVAQSLGPLSPTERADLIEEIASLFPPQPERTGVADLRKEIETALDGHTTHSRDCTLSGEYLASLVWPIIEKHLLSAAPPPPACQDHERAGPAVSPVRSGEAQIVAAWMMGHGYATGHGDTIEDMLAELELQAGEQAIRARR